MAVLSRRDLEAMFIFLAVLFLFDGYASGFFLFAVVIFVAMVVLALYSTKKDAMNIFKKQSDDNTTWAVRLAVALTLIGVLFGLSYIVALGFIFGEAILFSPITGIRLNIGRMSVVTEGKHRK